eukprot:CAMPEP_0172531222 /NCGR_PEP_ID=MMETSP1067-20121228/4711_1 /TAXON_ID=265564 ORGANISM="Thalassiosira punctigera, Strain Tpunct2005C2" /NCGR_SAMPLE_ID=MMETSP1067 /ASSEMBLY_ACC=CAM_ASM_000444 /LENGTH=727 /DNA_ID=CAMNT_0013315579 /DNA_START=123 /DNA_END=2306 /DNA_ORIENTATION=+
MKVETPQLRWHQIINPQSKKDAGANGPILSCSLLSIDDATGVLATAGNTEVNLWRVGFTEDAARASSSSSGDDGGNARDDDGTTRRSSSSSSHILVQPQTKGSDASELGEHTRIEHVATLSRGTNERGINAVKFSPSGLHLVAAGDGGTVVVWSSPPARDGAAGSPSFWSSIEKETDAPMKILFNQSDDVMDVAWSADSRRFAACSLDHTLTVWEQLSNGSASAGGASGAEWRNVHRSAKDHTHYIQGVAYDPQGVYLASMGSDRMVKVYSRKNVKENAVKGELAKYAVDRSSAEVTDEEEERRAILQSRVLPELLTNSAFTLQNKIKTMKFLNSKPSAANASSNDDAKNNERDASRPSSPTPNGAAAAKRHHMFADELTLNSFFRRLAFTTDGAFLVVPAALWHGRGGDRSAAGEAPASPTSVATGEAKLAESSFATYLFARHRFDQPYKVLTGLEKPSVVVRPNPIMFQLPPNGKSKPTPLPYRSVFAVLTADTVLIYDTHHDRPLAMARGLHYAGLTDAAWSADGRTLFVTSSDGYVSILSFGVGELGEVYLSPEVRVVEKVEKAGASNASSEVSEKASSGSEQSKSNSQVTINTLVPKKKKKTTAPTATIVAADSEGGGEKKVKFATPTDDRSNQPEPSQPVINMLVPKKKKKKKIAPTLVGTTAQQQGGSGKEDGENPAMERKRPAEEEAAPSTKVRELPIHTLIPKKKKKIASSFSPVATM